MESLQSRPRMPGAFSEESSSEEPAGLQCGSGTIFDGSPMARHSKPSMDSGQRSFDPPTRLESHTNYEAVTLADVVGWFFAYLGSLITAGGLFVFNPKSPSNTFTPLVCLRSLDYIRRKRWILHRC